MVADVSITAAAGVHTAVFAYIYAAATTKNGKQAKVKFAVGAAAVVMVEVNEAKRVAAEFSKAIFAQEVAVAAGVH